jgi:hypothetical protein
MFTLLVCSVFECVQHFLDVCRCAALTCCALRSLCSLILHLFLILVASHPYLFVFIIIFTTTIIIFHPTSSNIIFNFLEHCCLVWLFSLAVDTMLSCMALTSLVCSVLSRRNIFTWRVGSLHFVLHSLWHTHICWYLPLLLRLVVGHLWCLLLLSESLVLPVPPQPTSKFCIFNPPSSPSLSIFWTFLSCLTAFLCCQNRAVVHDAFYLLFAAFLSADSFWSGFNSCSHLIFRWCSSHFLDLHILAFWPPEFTFFSKLPEVHFSLHFHRTCCVDLHL